MDAASGSSVGVVVLPGSSGVPPLRQVTRMAWSCIVALGVAKVYG